MPQVPLKKRRRVGAPTRSESTSLPDLSHIPSNPFYYRSYMHRSVVTHVEITPTTVISASDDGRIVFWSRDAAPVRSNDSMRPGTTSAASSALTFIKAFQAHRGILSTLHLTARGDAVITTSASDCSLKVFTIATVDLAQFVKLPGAPAASVATVSSPDRIIVPLQACPYTLIISLQDVSAPPLIIQTSQREALAHLVVNRRFESLIICDASSALDYVRIPNHRPRIMTVNDDGGNGVEALDDDEGDISVQDRYGRKDKANDEGRDESDVSFPNGDKIDLKYVDEFAYDIPNVTFRTRLRTDLFALAKAKTSVTSISVSATGMKFAVSSTDGGIRVFDFISGRIIRLYDESRSAVSPSFMPAQELARRRARDNLFWNDRSSIHYANVAWDETGNCIVYATMLGIKVVHVSSNSVVRALGVREAAVRFVSVAVSQGDVLFDETLTDNHESSNLRRPLIVASGFDSERIFLFGSGPPVSEDSRDVYNERLFTQQRERNQKTAPMTTYSDNEGADQLAQRATLHTSMGDIMIKLLPKVAPRTVENFLTHATNGYFNGVTFHRVIRGFMIQTGDPDGDGTGGVSIWGESFEDEFDHNLKHEIGTVSMANAGPNTNGSVSFLFFHLHSVCLRSH